MATMTRSQKAQTNFGKADVTPYDGRTNWYAGGSAIGEMAVKYITCTVGKDTVTIKNQAKIRELRRDIKSYRETDDSVFAGTAKDDLIKAKEEQIAKLRKEIEDCEVGFEVGNREWGLYNDFYSNDPHRCGGIAISLYFATYGIKMGGRDVEYLVDALGGAGFKRGGSRKEHVLNCTCNVAGRKPKDFFETFIGEICDMMVAKGAIKPMAFPEAIRDRYTRKTKGAKSAK